MTNVPPKPYSMLTDAELRTTTEAATKETYRANFKHDEVWNSDDWRLEVRRGNEWIRVSWRPMFEGPLTRRLFDSQEKVEDFILEIRNGDHTFLAPGIIMAGYTDG